MAATAVAQCAAALRSAVERIAAEPLHIAAGRTAVAPLRIAVERPFDGVQSQAALTMGATVTMPAPAIPPTNIVAAAIMVAAFIAVGPRSIAAVRLLAAEQYEAEELVLLTMAAHAADAAVADIRCLGRCAPSLCLQSSALHCGGHARRPQPVAIPFATDQIPCKLSEGCGVA